jgi:hypothetical protein
VGARELVGRRADVHAGVVQHEVFEVDELALEPERGGGVGEMGFGDPAVADRARSQPLVKPRQRVFGSRQRPRELAPGERVRKAGAQGRHREAGLGRRGSLMTVRAKFSRSRSETLDGSKRCLDPAETARRKTGAGSSLSAAN